MSARLAVVAETAERLACASAGHCGQQRSRLQADGEEETRRADRERDQTDNHHPGDYLGVTEPTEGTGGAVVVIVVEVTHCRSSRVKPLVLR